MNNFSIILNEQTPKVEKIQDVNNWIVNNRNLIDDFLLFAKRNKNAIGLAANQLSLNGERLMANMFASAAGGKWDIYINPKIVDRSLIKNECLEGCLTWPNKKVVAERNSEIRVSWVSISGEECHKTLVGYEAQVWQHEQDHLDGIEEKIVERDYFTVRSEKIGRNEPCPCGKEVNGKVLKYKKCCGA